jgi:hypothetical protein
MGGAGNNFGQLLVTAAKGSGNTGNAVILETGTSSYTGLTANTATITSAQGSIILASTNTSITVSQGSFSAVTGNIALNNTKSASNYGNAPITLIAAGNASITDNNSSGTIIASGTTIGGNLVIINGVTTGVTGITDSSGTAGVKVTGSTSLTTLSTSASSGIILTNLNDSFGGGLFGSTSGTLSATVTGNLVLLGGTQANMGIFTASGNISNQVGVATDKFTTSLSVSTSSGNVTLSDPLWITGGFTGSLYVYAPLGSVDLSGLFKSIDLAAATPTVVSASGLYTPPKP